MTVVTARDPLKNYQFRVSFQSGGSSYIAGVKRVSGLNVTIAAHEIWSGGNNLHRFANPDKVNWDPVTLEQGLALNDELERWALAGLQFALTGSAPATALKRNLYVDVWDPHWYQADGRGSDGNQGNEPVRRFVLLNAWISRFQALPQFDAMSSEVALLSVELVHEGWRMQHLTLAQGTESVAEQNLYNASSGFTGFRQE